MELGKRNSQVQSGNCSVLAEACALGGPSSLFMNQCFIYYLLSHYLVFFVFFTLYSIIAFAKSFLHTPVLIKHNYFENKVNFYIISRLCDIWQNPTLKSILHCTEAHHYIGYCTFIDSYSQWCINSQLLKHCIQVTSNKLYGTYTWD